MSAGIRGWLPALFFFSGTSALVFQVVWMRMLVRVYGQTLSAASTVLAVFMGGLALGAWAAGLWLSRSGAKGFPLRVYGALELGVAILVLPATELTRLLPAVYAALSRLWGAPLPSDGGFLETTVRLVLAALVLVPPAALMGATLPVLAAWATRRDSEVGRRLAGLYGWNTLGGALGVAAAGFAGIALLGERGTVWSAAALSAAVGAVVLSAGGAAEPCPPAAEPGQPVPTPRRLFLILGAVSGLCAMGFEVAWTRLLILLMGSSVYAFSMMLAFFLLGIALGSVISGPWLDRSRRPALLYGLGLSAAGLAGGLGLRCFQWAGALAWEPKYLYSPLQGPQDLAWFAVAGAVLVLPLTAMFGMLFPLLGRLVAGGRRGAGTGAASLYVWNTLGGVGGALLAGVWLIPALGTERVFALLCLCVSATGAGALLLTRPRGPGPDRRVWNRAAAAAACCAIAAAAVLPWSGEIFLDTVRRRLAVAGYQGQVLLHRDDPAAAVTALRLDDGKGFLLLNGIEVSASGRAGSIMAHVPLLLHPRPEKVLVICLGVGNTFRAAVGQVERVDVVELVGGVVEAFPLFHGDADRFLRDPGVRIFVGDGRGHLLVSSERYDAVIVDGSPPIFSAGTVNLYTLEFLRLVRKRLSAEGIFALWIPTPCFDSDFWMLARNFTEVFPEAAAWTHPKLRGALLLGSAAPFDLSPEFFERRLRERGYASTDPWLTRNVFARGWRAGPRLLRRRAAAFPVVSDDRPRTEFPLGAFLSGKELRTVPAWFANIKPGP